MVGDVTSSSLGAAVALQQGQVRQEQGVRALNQTAQQEQQTVTALLGGASGGSGGNVTETRGQNLNITV